MKRLPFQRRRVAFRCGLYESAGVVRFQSGIIEGHFVERSQSLFSGECSWVRYYSIKVTSGPACVRGLVVQCFAEWVFRYPVCERVHQS